MITKFTVFGQLIEKGQSAHVYFDKSGQTLSCSIDAVAHVEFEIDEAYGLVGLVRMGTEYFDSGMIYFGDFSGDRFARASISCFNGRLVICARCKQENGVNQYSVWAAKMKLWLLTVDSSVGEGALVSLIVRAEDEESARQLAAEKSSEDRGHDYRHDATTETYLGDDCWLKADRTSIQEISSGAESVVHVERS